MVSSERTAAIADQKQPDSTGSPCHINNDHPPGVPPAVRVRASQRLVQRATAWTSHHPVKLHTAVHCGGALWQGHLQQGHGDTAPSARLVLLVGAELSVGILAHEAIKLRGVRDLDLREPALGLGLGLGFGFGVWIWVWIWVWNLDLGSGSSLGLDLRFEF